MTNVKLITLCGLNFTNAVFDVARDCAFIGEGTGPIFLDEFQCFGAESELVHCTAGVNDCVHSEDAAWCTM